MQEKGGQMKSEVQEAIVKTVAQKAAEYLIKIQADAPAIHKEPQGNRSYPGYELSREAKAKKKAKRTSAKRQRRLNRRR